MHFSYIRKNAACSTPSWGGSVTKRSEPCCHQSGGTRTRARLAQQARGLSGAHTVPWGVRRSSLAICTLHPAEHGYPPSRRRTPSPPGCRLSDGPSAPGQRRRRAGGAWLVEAVHGAYPPGEEAASRRHLDVAPRSATTSASEWCTCAEQAARASPSSAEPARTTY